MHLIIFMSHNFSFSVKRDGIQSDDVRREMVEKVCAVKIKQVQTLPKRSTSPGVFLFFFNKECFGTHTHATLALLFFNSVAMRCHR